MIFTFYFDFFDDDYCLSMFILMMPTPTYTFGSCFSSSDSNAYD